MPTIGVAVAIPEPWARDLQHYRLSVGDVTATQIPTHITLIPPVEVGVEDLEAIEDHLRDAAGCVGPFEVHLRGTGSFRPVSPVVFVTLAEGISACEQLADAVRQGPLAIELAFPYHPHVTIAHHLPDDVLDLAFDDLAGFECVFEATAFHLYLHDDNEGWRPTREFRLVGTG
ncbi:2'-5' RNA ligase family protein [Nocardioides sp.]|uniref:2'-5' RNA ligase family protein n=1 Tax=Nocardioides sp. TaxID=35761 RepID=UPI003527A585